MLKRWYGSFFALIIISGLAYAWVQDIKSNAIKTLDGSVVVRVGRVYVVNVPSIKKKHGERLETNANFPGLVMSKFDRTTKTLKIAFAVYAYDYPCGLIVCNSGNARVLIPLKIISRYASAPAGAKKANFEEFGYRVQIDEQNPDNQIFIKECDFSIEEVDPLVTATPHPW